MTYTLIIDTSTERGIVLLTAHEKVCFERLLPFGLQSSKYLFSTIQEGLKTLALSPVDIGAVAVAVGPGSFTGIRVGVAAAKGIAYPRGLPLIGFSTLEGFSGESPFAVVVDARVGGAYVLLEGQTPQFVVTERLKEILEGCGDIVGPSFAHLPLEGGRESAPDGALLAKRIEKRRAQGDFSQEAEILYLR